jgi:hypothetical protein
VAYVAKKGEKWTAVVDGIPSAEYDQIKFPPVFSPDSKRIAYEVKSGEKWFEVLDGRESGECGLVYVGPAFSQDSRHIVYLCKNGMTFSLVLDGQPGSAYDQILLADNIFSPGDIVEFLGVRDNSLYRVKSIPPP